MEVSNPPDNSEDVSTEQASDAHLGLLGPRSHVQQTVLRCSGLVYVCWHRRLTVSLENILNANEVSSEVTQGACSYAGITTQQNNVQIQTGNYSLTFVLWRCL